MKVIFLIIIIIIIICVVNYIFKKKKVREKLETTFFNNYTKRYEKIKMCYKNSEKCDFPNCSHPCCNSILLEMLQNITNVFKDAKIPFWIAFGTLLGLRRHNGFIPWDDDVDTMTTASIEEVKKLIPKIEDFGYVIKYNKKYKKEGSYTPSYEYYSVLYSKTNYNHIDIAIMTKIKIDNKDFLFDGPSQFHNTILKNKEKYNSWLCPLEYIFPLDKKLFYNILVNTPSNVDSLLKYWYGNDCLEIAKIKKKNSSGIQNADTYEEIKDFLPGNILKTLSVNLTPNQKYGIYKCLIINVENQHDRLHHSIEQCEKYNLWAERLPAVSGNDIKTYPKEIFQVNENYKKQMSNNTLACYLSHVKALEEVSKLPDGFNCLILEDDIVFRDNFDNVMRQVKQDLEKLDWDIIFLGSCMQDSDNVLRVSENLAKTGLNTGTWAYMVNSKSAKFILKSILPIMYPFDLAVTVGETFFEHDNCNYDMRYIGLKKYCVMSEKFPSKYCIRYGIIDELSTEWNDSSST